MLSSFFSSYLPLLFKIPTPPLSISYYPSFLHFLFSLICFCRSFSFSLFLTFLILSPPSFLLHSHSSHPMSSPSTACLCVQCGTPVCVCVHTVQTSDTLPQCSCCEACTSQTALPGWSLGQVTSSDAQRVGRMCHSEWPG